MRYSFVILGLAGIALAACEQLPTPIYASAAPAGATPGGTTASTPLTVLPGQITLLVATSAQLTTNAPAALQSQVQWRSLEPAIAAVNTGGVVTALSAGTAIVQARFAFDTTQVATSLVTVIAPTAPGTGG